MLDPLKAEIDAEKSTYVVGRVKVEITLFKKVLGRWGNLVADPDDPSRHFNTQSS